MKSTIVLFPLITCFLSLLPTGCGDSEGTVLHQMPTEIVSVLHEAELAAYVDMFYIEEKLDSMLKDSIISQSEYDSVQVYVDSINWVVSRLENMKREMISKMEGVPIDVVDTLKLALMRHSAEIVQYNEVEMEEIGNLIASVDSMSRLMPDILDRFYQGHYPRFVGHYSYGDGDSLVTWEVINIHNRTMGDLIEIYPAVRLHLMLHRNTMLHNFTYEAWERDKRRQ